MEKKQKKKKKKTERKWRVNEESGGSYTRIQNWETSTY